MTKGNIKVDIYAIIEDNSSVYAKTRRRLYNQYHKDLSDKEMIEELSNEIDYYRDKIDKLTTVQNRNEYEDTSDNTEDELEDKNMIMQKTSLYADGRLRETTTRYTYKDEQEAK